MVNAIIVLLALVLGILICWGAAVLLTLFHLEGLVTGAVIIGGALLVPHLIPILKRT